jgi:hypothetical protein
MRKIGIALAALFVVAAVATAGAFASLGSSSTRSVDLLNTQSRSHAVADVRREDRRADRRANRREDRRAGRAAHRADDRGHHRGGRGGSGRSGHDD